jgi:penicillin amidase
MYDRIKRLRWCAVAIGSLCLTACAWLTPKPVPRSTAQLLDSFPSQAPWPIRQPVRIHWQENMVPFIEAETDADCAFAIGVVHAFLRLGQMEVFRRGSAGRLAESVGPIAAPDLDLLIRKLQLDRAAEQSEALMRPEDRLWLARYLEGINFFIEHTPDLPPEFALLALQPEPWTARDSLRIGKLGSADPNWTTLLGLLPLREKTGWEAIWQQVLEGARQSLPTAASASTASSLSGLQQLLNLSARSGSNSLVVGGERSASGAALIASDPHLGIFVPNLWVLMGYRCPSYQVVGYMLPGVPATPLGRNPQIAWGGTAMRGISTHLFAVEAAQITGIRTETLRIRGWPDRQINIEESTLGPVVYENAQQKVALNWTGHQAGDDLGAFLAASRAQDWPSFRKAFVSISGPSLNLTYADAKGHIGFLPAIRQPLLHDPSQQDLLVKSSSNGIAGYRSQHPSLLDPPEGFIASANNLPVQTSPLLALPSADNGRKRRLDTLASATAQATVQDLMRWQQDVFSAEALALNGLLLERLGDTHTDPLTLARLRGWDGRYEVASSGAVAHEVVIWHLAQALVEAQTPDETLRKRWLAFDDWRQILLQDFSALPADEARQKVAAAIAASASEVQAFPTWGDWHQQPVQSPLGLLPVLGARYRYGRFPSAGGSSTVNKAGFSSGAGPREVIFGAQVRHISDMADVDANYFVMLGGNAGWLDNAALTDQIPLWRKGEYLHIPLSKAGVARGFRLRTHRILPAGVFSTPVTKPPPNPAKTPP